MQQPDRTAIMRETFDIVSDAYDGPALRFFSASAVHFAASLPLRGAERVIDIATGTGNLALELAGRLPSGKVTGIDFSSGMLAQARNKAESRRIRNVEFIEMNMQDLSPDEAGFDLATCAFGIFFVEDMDAQLARIAALVRDGGVIAICNFQEDYFNPLRELLFHRMMSYGVQLPPQTWKRIATEAGCRELFARAGIGDVRVDRKNMGYYLADPCQWWEIVWNAGYRGLLRQLQPDALEHFRREHLREVAALATRDGIWLDIGVLFTRGVKGATS